MAEIFENNRTSFFAWQSEDDAIWPDWTYLASENIEVKRFWKFVELAKAPINSINDGDTSAVMKLWIDTPNPLWIDPIFFMWDSGKVIREDWVNVYTETWSRSIRNHVFNLWDALYFTTSDGSSNPMRLNKILHSDIDSNWTWSVSEDILSWDPLELIEAWSWWFHRFLVVWTKVYISTDTKIAEFNHNTWVVDAQYDFFSSQIVWMTYWWWHIKVFLKNWLMFLWDGQNAEQPLDIIDLWEKLENAISIWSVEYVIWWDLWGLSKFFILDGRRLRPINKKQHSRLLWIDKFNITTTWNVQNIARSDNQIFLVDRLESWWSTFRVATYWNKINWLPKWYSVDLTKNSNWNTMGNMNFIFSTQWKLFFWYSNTPSDRWVDHINLEQTDWSFASEWFLIDNLFDWWDIIKIKKEEKLYWKCVIPSWTSIEILQSVNWSAFVSCKIIDENSVLDNWVFTLSQTSFNKTNYRQVAYKVILSTTNTSNTPRWYWFKTKYSFTN